jgi:hypothetical protein
MTFPRITCVVTVPVPVKADRADLRRAARDCHVVPAGAVVRLRLGSALSFNELDAPLLAERLTRASRVEVEGDDVATALGLHASLLAAWSSGVSA